MLQNIRIKNIALIDDINIDLCSGFNVLTGETGAGKSIIVDSINLILGARADKDLIKSGETSAKVEASFCCGAKEIEILHAHNIDVHDGSVTIVRELYSTGKSTARINGKVVPASVLKTVSRYLINIYGQNDSQSILTDENHLDIFDAYFSDELDDNKKEYLDTYLKYKQLKQKAEKLNMDEAERGRLIDMLKFQINEIDSAALKIGEEEELDEQRSMLKNAERITASVGSAKAELSDSALGAVYRAVQAMSAIADVNEKYKSVYDELSNCYYTLDDISSEIASLSVVEYSDSAMDDVEDRISVIKSLKRKYGADIAQILQFKANAEDELNSLENIEYQMEDLIVELDEAYNNMQEAANALSAKRTELAKSFEKDMVQQLNELGMPAAQFMVDISNCDYAESGNDSLMFYITVNKGEPLKPLAKVVSGGEASRIMLALKTLTAAKECVETLIFDEVDAGISGRISQIVAKKIASIAADRQVICITHLPVVAAVGDANYYIEKYVENDKTKTSVKRLKKDEVIREIARLTGGIQNDAALNHASDLLKFAEELKKSYSS